MRKRSEAGAELKEEIEKNEVPERVEFTSAHRPVERPMSPDFERIVETVLIENPLTIYKALEAALRIGDGRSDLGSVNRALDEAESNARLAHRLWMTARVERERWELENEVVFAAMKIAATKVLQEEKAAGHRNKAITDADVTSMCAVMFRDEWCAQEVKRKKVEAMSRTMESLSECWMSRCRSLQAILGKIR